MTLLAHAVAAVQRGAAVFPCNPAGTVDPEDGRLIDKEPHLILPTRPWKLKWSEQATRDLDRVIGWWRQDPNSNPAIACKQSGLLVVDCDGPKADNLLAGGAYEELHHRFGPRPHGDDVLREMCARYGGSWPELMDTYRVCTGSLGVHLYFWWPPGVQASQGSPVPHFVDVRVPSGSRGGYVLAAGSVTTKGPYSVEHDVPIRPAPAWLVELVREKPRPQQPQSPFQQPKGSGSFAGLVDAVRYAPEGNRNQTMLWAACRMASDGASQEQAEAELVPAAEIAGLSGAEALGVIRNAYRLTAAGQR